MSARRRKILAPEASCESRVAVIGEAPTPSKDIESPAHRRALARCEARKDLVSIADQVAGDVMFFKNYRWPEANRHYPEDVDAMMRFVSRYYPHAKEGPLYVDEPKSALEAKRCAEKRKIMAKSKLRYVVLNRSYEFPEGTTVPAATLLDAMEQLGGE